MIRKVKVEHDNYDRLGGHFDISTEDESDIHVVFEIGKHPKHDTQFLAVFHVQKP